MNPPLIDQPMPVLVVLLGMLAFLFYANQTAAGQKLFRYIPLLIFAYFMPTALSNSCVIPMEASFPLYGFVNDWLLPNPVPGLRLHGRREMDSADLGSLF